MKNPKLIIQICNLFNGLAILTFFFKLTYLFDFLVHVKLLHIIVAVMVIYGIKSWVEMRYDVSDPIKTNKVTNALFYAGYGVIVVGIILQITISQYHIMAFIAGASLMMIAYVLSFFVSENKREKNPEILDDL